MSETEKDYWQAWARKRLEIQRKHWLRAAKSALAGDMRELRNRVELSEAEPVDIVQSAASEMIGEAATDNRHEFVPNKKYPWFCAHCGYAPHEPLKHTQPPRAAIATGDQP